MKINLIATKEILDFEKEIECELIVNEQDTINKGIKLAKYLVKFENSFLANNNFNFDKQGNGDTIDAAIINYCNLVSCKTIVFINNNEKKTLIFPRLIHTKLLNK